MNNQTPPLWHPMSHPPQPCADCNGHLEDWSADFTASEGVHHVAVIHDDTCPWYRAYVEQNMNRAERRANRKAQR